MSTPDKLQIAKLTTTLTTGMIRNLIITIIKMQMMKISAAIYGIWAVEA